MLRGPVAFWSSSCVAPFFAPLFIPLTLCVTCISFPTSPARASAPADGCRGNHDHEPQINLWAGDTIVVTGQFECYLVGGVLLFTEKVSKAFFCLAEVWDSSIRVLDPNLAANVGDPSIFVRLVFCCSYKSSEIDFQSCLRLFGP